MFLIRSLNRKNIFSIGCSAFLILFTLLPVPILKASEQPADSLLMGVMAQGDSLITEKPLEVANDEKTTEENVLTTEVFSRPEGLRNVISLAKIFWSLVIILLGYLVIGALNSLAIIVSRKNARYRTLIKRALPLVRILGWSMVVYIIIQGIIQPPMQTILAFFASIGVAIGFASQDLLKNVFGGLMILFDKPFQIGDKVEAGKHYGEVIEIGLRTTRLLTEDDSIISVPNADLMNQSISNSNSGENNCMVVAELFLPLNIDTAKVREIATEAAMVSPLVFLNKPITVHFINEMNNKGSYLKMRLRAYVLDVTSEKAFQSEMTEVVLKELIAQGHIQQSFYPY